MDATGGTAVMEKLSPILLDVWREVGRHIEIAACASNVARTLRRHVPLARLCVHRLDAEHKRVVLAASDSVTPAPEPPELSPPQFKRLTAWVRQGNPQRFGGRQEHHSALGFLASLASRDIEAIAAPLVGPHGALGVLSVVPSEDRFDSRQSALIRSLQEPLAAALDNDHRIHELAVLRQAAEADRVSLLARLGRKEMSDPVVGDGSGLKNVMERVRQISRSDVPVLILGETGTGKELIARAIHTSSDRSAGPFIRVNCGAIPRELIDSQLFGHEKGSFTGADEQRQGWFERADGGTLFLDEIGELPPDAQVRFLRVLQDGFVERVGGTRPIHVNVRVVAATHRDLAGMIEAGGFREDLWYRIAVFPVLIPPLRDRKQDIPELVEHFVQKAARRFGLPPVVATKGDIALLLSYNWPGNVRELGAVIDRAVILGEGKGLEVAASLGFAVPQETKRVIQEESPRSATNRPGTRPQSIVSLDEATKLHIEVALEATRGKVEGAHGAAALLGINPHTLRARMRKLEIDWTQFRAPRAM